jgi:hypothetical protein
VTQQFQPPITISQVGGPTVLVDLSDGEAGAVTIGVEARDATGCTVGMGASAVVVARCARATVSVTLSGASACSTVDGGSGVDGDANGDGGRVDCDPRSVAATAGSSACPTGQACLIVGSGDQVDCADPGASRTKAEGADCTSSAECLPGLICSFMGATQKCYAICRCGAQALACSANDDDCPTAATHCTPLANQTMFGVCLQ